MTQILLDPSLARRLDEVTQIVEMCDPTGRLLGHFLPLIDPSQWEPVSPGVTEEELDRRAVSAEPRYPTSEVLARLDKL
jgi:hypothetical protein